jgi:hypothetical protein
MEERPTRSVVLDSRPLRALWALEDRDGPQQIVLPPGHDLDRTIDLLLRQEIGALEAEERLNRRMLDISEAIRLGRWSGKPVNQWQLDRAHEELGQNVEMLRALRGENGRQWVAETLGRMRLLSEEEARSAGGVVYSIPCWGIGLVEPLRERLEAIAVERDLELDDEDLDAAAQIPSLA